MSVRFLANADLSYAIVQGIRIREPAIDFKSANDAGLEGRSDLEVLELAAHQGRVLVSHDKRTMPVHFAARTGSGLKSPGVLLALPSASIGEIVESLLIIWSASREWEWWIRFTTSHPSLVTTSTIKPSESAECRSTLCVSGLLVPNQVAAKNQRISVVAMGCSSSVYVADSRNLLSQDEASVGSQ